MRVLLIFTALLAAAVVCQGMRVQSRRPQRPRRGQRQSQLQRFGGGRRGGGGRVPVASFPVRAEPAEPSRRRFCTTDDGLVGVCRPLDRCPPRRLRLTATRTDCPPGGRRGTPKMCCPYKNQDRRRGQPATAAPATTAVAPVPVVTEPPAVSSEPPPPAGPVTSGPSPAGGGGSLGAQQGGRFGPDFWQLLMTTAAPSGGDLPFGGFGSPGGGSSASLPRPGSGGGLFFGVNPSDVGSGTSPSDGASGSESNRGSLNPWPDSGGSSGGFFVTEPSRPSPTPSTPSGGGFAGSGSSVGGFAGSGSSGSGFAGSGLSGGSFAGGSSPSNGNSGSDSSDSPSGAGGSSSGGSSGGGFAISGASGSLSGSGFAGGSSSSSSPSDGGAGNGSSDGPSGSGFAGNGSSGGSFVGSVLSGGTSGGGFAGSESSGSGFAGIGSFGDGFAGSGSSGDGFTGSGSSGSGFAGSGSSGTGFAGSGSSGNSFTGSDSSGNGFAGSGSSDSGFAGSGSSGSGFAGSGSSGNGFAGSGSSGSGFAGSGSSGSGFAGSGSSGNGFTGSGSPGNGFAGSGSSGSGFASGSPSSGGSSGDRFVGSTFGGSRPSGRGSSNSDSSDGFGGGGGGFASGGDGLASGGDGFASGGGGFASGGDGFASGDGGFASGGGGRFGGGQRDNETSSAHTEAPVEATPVAPLHTVCGRPTPKTVWLQAGQAAQERSALLFEIRVVGGKNAEIGKWPWIALIGHQQDNKPPFFFCGGTLIDNRNVLTAAHCLKRRAVNLDTLIVRLGEYDTSTDNDGASPQDFRVTDFTNHEDYAFPVLHDDISLVHLAKPVVFTEAIKPICLPSGPSGDYGGTTGDVAGWGYTEFDGETSNILQEVELPVVAVPECQAVYEDQMSFKNQFPGGFGDNKLCAGGTVEGGKDACQGDSGGPLVHLVEDGRYEQIGVVSAGVGCGRPGFPGIYTRVSAYLDWIQRTKK